MRAITAGELALEVADLRGEQRGLLMYALVHDNKRAERHRTEFRESLKKAKSSVVTIRPLITSPEGKALIAAVAMQTSIFIRHHSRSPRAWPSAAK